MGRSAADLADTVKFAHSEKLRSIARIYLIHKSNCNEFSGRIPNISLPLQYGMHNIAIYLQKS